jgi:predicted MFS family arabinose efflux permease
MLRAIVRSYRDAFTGLPRQVWVLALCLFVNRAGMMVLPFLELYLTGERGFAVDAAGRLVSLYGVGSILGVTAGGWLTDRFGARAVQLWSLTANALALLVLWRARTALGIGAAVMAVSVAADAFRPANGAAIAAAVGVEARARSFSLMSLAVNLGLSFGLPIGGLLARADFDWLFWIDAGTALVAALVLATLTQASGRAREAQERERGELSPWRDGFFLLAVGLVCATATVLFQFFGALPVFLAHDLGFDEGQVGLALALNTLVAAAFGMLVVRWVERRSELRWIGVGSFLICAGYGVNALPGGASIALLSIVVWSVGEMFFFPLAASFASSRAASAAVGRYMSVYHLAFALAFILAPLVGTQVYESCGPAVLWLGCAAAGALLWAAYELLERWSSARGHAPCVSRDEHNSSPPGGL